MATPLDGTETPTSPASSASSASGASSAKTSWGNREIDAFPSAIVLGSGATTLCTHVDGSMDGDGRSGLFDWDTRILSRHRLLVNGFAPELLTSAVIDACKWTATMRVARDGGTVDGPLLPQDALEVTLVRRVGNGMLEELEVANHSVVACAVDITLELDADFIEVLDLESARHQRGTTKRRFECSATATAKQWHAVHTDQHEGRALRRESRARIVEISGFDVDGDERGMGLRAVLTPHGRARVAIAYEHFIDGAWRSPLALGVRALHETERDRARREWDATRAHCGPRGTILADAFEQAAEDLFSLRLWEIDVSAGDRAATAWLPAAGVPLYSSVFGRDSLTVGWQAALLGPEIARGALEMCARTQGRRDDPFRDEEPGRMIHEMRRGPLSELGVIPQERYYGSQTTPAMFVVALSELWHWTGDDALLERYLDSALRACAWAEKYGDLDGDGLIEYRRRAPFGPKNQGWKDSDEAIRYADGTQVENPIATVEENAFHFIALERMAEILTALGDDTRAAEFLAKADALKQRWHEAFWMPHERFYAMALDAQKKQVTSIGSNVGHALGAGIVPTEHVKDVVQRLLAPDMFSGWGVRTLSTLHPSYNPFAYHLGTVWPVENATFALACKRYGLDEEAERIVTAQLLCASHFRDARLPEALSGHSVDERAAPTTYPGTNSPQAWSASAAIQHVQILLGAYAFAPLHALVFVRPRLPAWLPSLTLRNIAVGDARVSVHFERDRHGHTRGEVLGRSGGTVHVATAPPPKDVSGRVTPLEALKSFFLEHAPGRRVRALRIALGDRP